MVRRVVLGVVAVLVVAAAYTAYQAYRTERDLTKAEASGNRLIAAVRDKDTAAQRAALSDFLLSSKSAHDRTNGRWWRALAHLPVVGDDAHGVRALSASLDSVSSGAASLVDVVNDLDKVVSGGKVDVATVRSLQAPVEQANADFATGRRDIAGLDSSGYVGPLKTKFDTYSGQLDDIAGALASGNKAIQVLPGFLGGDGPRNYLLIFQNNAEIRATGGMPGSWAEVHADGGALSITRQGTAADFPRRDTPVLPLSDGELGVYSDLLGVYFQDATFTPDFPRAAQLLSARWEETYPDKLDGVISIDPVALSYLLKGTGPVNVGDATLTSSNAVEQLLNKPYLDLTTDQQDEFFAEAARAIFSAVKGHLDNPTAFIRGLAKATDERRFYVAPFDDAEAKALAGSQALGAMPAGDTTTPHVFVGLSDATASKMSYYLRYRTDVTARSCSAGVQTLDGTMSLDQTITAAQAQQLPESITGAGDFGTPVGDQLVAVRVYGPSGGSISDIKFNGSAIQATPVQLDGRPVVTLVAELNGPDDVRITWTMQTGKGQTGDGVLGVTPSVQPGGGNESFHGAC